MVPVVLDPDDAGVPRLLVLWSRPHHLSDEEAERWARAELRGVATAPGIRSLQLRRLEAPSPRYAGDWRWLLELEIDGPARACVESGPCGEWLADLRLLGMRAEVVVAAEAVELRGD
jgi:hypothetical protein